MKLTLGRLRESGAEQKTCRWCDARGIVHFKLTPLGQRGWNDRLFLLPLRPLLIEFKAPGEDPRKLQAYRHLILSELNYETQNHVDAEEAIAAIREAIEVRKRELRVLHSVGLGRPGQAPQDPRREA